MAWTHGVHFSSSGFSKLMSVLNWKCEKLLIINDVSRDLLVTLASPHCSMDRYIRNFTRRGGLELGDAVCFSPCRLPFLIGVT